MRIEIVQKIIDKFKDKLKKQKRKSYVSINPKVKSQIDTIKALSQEGRSICRYGDGEFQLMQGNKILFQDSDENLAKRLREIFNSNEDNILIGTNYFYWQNVNNFRPTCKYFYETWVPENLPRIESFMNTEKQYYDAGFTQPYTTFKNYDFESHFELLKNLWRNKDITIICGETIFDKISVNIFDCANSIDYIYAPSKNAFSKYDSILNQALEIDKTRLVIIILGPTATVLAYDLAKQGYTALDFGHVAKDYDYYKKDFKHTNETIVDFFKPD